MASDKQIQANKQNAKLGGVKTETGKEISKYNALKHGLLAKNALFEGENAKDLESLGKAMRTSLKPQGTLEQILTDRIISSIWRLQRVIVLEKNTGDEYGQLDQDKFIRYEAHIERGLYRALHELQRVQAARDTGTKPNPVAVDLNLTPNE